VCTPAQIINTVLWSNNEQGTLNNNLPSGSYSYEITTNYGCQYAGMHVVETEPDLAIQYITTPFSDTGSGSAEFFVWGGVAPFEFILDSINVGSSISGLNPGSYSILITDQNGCSDSVNFIIQNVSTADFISPAKDHFWVSIDGQIITIVDDNINTNSVEIFDVTGKKMILNSMKILNNGIRFELLASPGIDQVRTDRWTQTISLLE
jgi:hypothetical protein